MSTTRDAILRAAVDRTGEETVYDPKDFTGSDAAADRGLASLMKRQSISNRLIGKTKWPSITRRT
jgi:hypothetical protein